MAWCDHLLHSNWWRMKEGARMAPVPMLTPEKSSIRNFFFLPKDFALLPLFFYTWKKIEQKVKQKCSSAFWSLGAKVTFAIYELNYLHYFCCKSFSMKNIMQTFFKIFLKKKAVFPNHAKAYWSSLANQAKRQLMGQQDINIFLWQVNKCKGRQ